MPLFQQVPTNEENGQQVLDPWTNACRGLFEPQPPPDNVTASVFPDDRQFNGMFNELPRDVSGLNGTHLPDVKGENPLGAIGTPVAKNYSLFDSENRNPLMQQAARYRMEPSNHSPYFHDVNAYGNGGLGQSYNAMNHFGMAGGSNAEVPSGIGQGYNGYGMDNVYGQMPNSLYSEYQQQKQELQRLALLLAMNNQALINPIEVQQQQQQHNLNTHTTSSSLNGGFNGWDDPLFPQQQHLRPQLSPPMQPRQPFSGRSGGPPPPPPGMGPNRRSEGNGNQNPGTNGDNPYDPFRSLWN